MLKDRFGELPKEVNELLITVQIKWLGIEFGFEKIVMRKNLLKAYFISNSKSDYYETETFLSVLNFVNNHPDICKLQEKKTKDETKLILYIYQIQRYRTSNVETAGELTVSSILLGFGGSLPSSMGRFCFLTPHNRRTIVRGHFMLLVFVVFSDLFLV